MAKAVGALSSSISFYRAIKDVRDEILRLRRNSKRRTDFTIQVDKLLEILWAATSISGPAEELVDNVVQDVKRTLESLVAARNRGRMSNPVSKFLAAREEANKLDEVQEKLKSLTTQVVVVGSICKLEKELPRVWNDTYEPPECKVGLDRANRVLDFLQTSLGQEFRVVCIQGMPGIGKTTILHHVWNRASLIAPFAARAHVQLGSSINDDGISKLQSVIFEQLSGGENLSFTAPEGGRAKLSKHLQQLKEDKKPVFLLVDNVLEGEDLKRLLPATLSKDIPASSVIAITCRTFPVVRDLLSLCHLDKQKNVSQIQHFVPTCLNPADSKELFANCGDLSYSADADLLESLVPLCDGFPLALCVLGGLFTDGAKRSREEWELIKEQMERLDGDGTETSRVTKALQVMYDQLNEKRKTAFCEVVECFYGWDWERVERILGKNVLNDLKESSLISEAPHWSTCNQSALCEGYRLLSWSKFRPGCQRVVIMHDLTFRFGKDLCANAWVMRKRGYRAVEDFFARFEASKLRHLILQGDSSKCGFSHDDSKIEFLKEAVNLQTLYLEHVLFELNSLLKACSYRNIQSTDERPSLRFLKLEYCTWSTIILQLKLSRDIREIHLYDCGDVEQLPSISLPNLEVLSVETCENFQSFSPSSVRSWCSLKYLHISRCDRLTCVPADLGRLEKLSNLTIDGCHRLQALPTLSSPLQKLCLAGIPVANLEFEETACLRLRQVHLGELYNLKSLPSSVLNALSLRSLSLNLPELVELPEEMGNLAVLTELNLSRCKSLKRLSPSIGNATSLQALILHGCEDLVELPDEVGKLTALTELDLCSCKRLKGLPPTIGEATSLKALNLAHCESLVGLPDEVGKLTALTELNLCSCKRLKGLPPTIGKATSLKALNLADCESLVGLPDEVGELAVLTELYLSRCKSLNCLPPAIMNAASLQVLHLSGSDWVELPEEVGNLTALKELILNDCKSLRTLPQAIGNAVSIEKLWLGRCKSVVGLPEEVGQLTELKSLSLWGCKSLKTLPPAIGNAVSLECLCLQRCKKLVELPEEVGKLTALKELDLMNCKSLRTLPQAIGNAVSLENLSLEGCESVVELPEEVGELTALKELDLRNCKSLKLLQQAVGNAVSLESLQLEGCEKLVEMPEKVGKLTALKKLDLSDCKSLKTLPQAIGNAVSLESLWLYGCESAVELPEEVGKLTALGRLDLRNCKSLKTLPQAIGNAVSLEILLLEGCESLVELPEEVGKLTALIKLDLRNCKSLKTLPQAIGSAASLTWLSLEGCESMVELPEEVGKLTSLIELDLRNCNSLKTLPQAIGNLASLTWLRLEGCESVVELPEEVGKLTAWKDINLNNCKRLKAAGHWESCCIS